MKVIKFSILSACFFFVANLVNAQDQVDALRFSRQFLQGDARSAGTGSAFGAIGANFLSTSINPAGLAFYRSNEFALTLGLNTLTAEGAYLGQKTTDHKSNFNIPDIDLVYTTINTMKGKEVTDGWVSHTFGIGFIRTNNFSANTTYEGVNTSSSVLDYYSQVAGKTDPQNLSLNNVGGLAWDSYLINLDSTNSKYIPVDTYSINNFFQKSRKRTWGSSYDLNISFAANYSNKLFLGGTITIPTVGYHERSTFYEENQQTNHTYISSTYERDLNISGAGIRAGFGIIYKPLQFIRIGGSVVSPTYNSLHANYTQTMQSVLDTFNGYSSSEGSIDFNLTTPFRATASLGLILGKYGFVDVDYDYVDYSAAYMNSNVYGYTNENNNIASIYTATQNIRVGAEFKYDIFALRGGYAIYGSPYSTDAKPAGADASTTVYSFGLGIREQDYFLDFAYQMYNSKEFTLPYSLNGVKAPVVEGAINTLSRSNFLLTFGLKF